MGNHISVCLRAPFPHKDNMRIEMAEKRMVPWLENLVHHQSSHCPSPVSIWVELPLFSLGKTRAGDLSLRLPHWLPQRPQSKIYLSTVSLMGAEPGHHHIDSEGNIYLIKPPSSTHLRILGNPILSTHTASSNTYSLSPSWIILLWSSVCLIFINEVLFSWGEMEKYFSISSESSRAVQMK